MSLKGTEVSGVPTTMISMKQDVMLTIDESRKLKSQLGETVEYIELNGGHSTYFIGKDASFVSKNILPSMAKYNPLK